MLPARLGCPLGLKTPNMGNTGLSAKTMNATTRNDEMKNQALRIAAMLTLALLVPFFLIACGDTV